MNSRMIKVCGMREADNIRQVEALGIDWLGFIFWPKSSRFVHERPAYLPASAKRVGVFVDADIEVVRETAAAYCLDIIQLHGKESPSYIKQLRSLCSDHVAVIIKAFNIATPFYTKIFMKKRGWCRTLPTSLHKYDKIVKQWLTTTYRWQI